MTATTDADADAERLEEYVNRLAGTHGISGYTPRPDGTVVYAAHTADGYDLRTETGWLTDADGDVTSLEWLDGRETLLALRDVDGSEQSDLLEVDLA
jgi:hypothetical protein